MNKERERCDKFPFEWNGKFANALKYDGNSY